MPAHIVDRADFDDLFLALADLGYTPIGPVLVDDAIRLGEVAGIDALPAGWKDAQDGGTYRLVPREDAALFGYAVGPDSPKRYLYPPRTTVLQITASDGRLVFEQANGEAPRLAFVGIRPCEIAAIEIQDRVFLDVDPTYTVRRRRSLFIAANCTDPSGTCFCASMGTGPGADHGFDLAFTELIDPDRHRFLFTVATDAGAEVLDRLPTRAATDADEAAAAALVEAAAARMGRAMDTDHIRDLLVDNPNHPRWGAVAERCLACANCTMACPTCFCSTTADSVGFEGVAERSRLWDSCFTLDFSAVHGTPVRHGRSARYRQWMTHKLATWHDQFGVSGCVGCGRCITWCPVGIDITEEVAAIREEVS